MGPNVHYAESLPSKWIFLVLLAFLNLTLDHALAAYNPPKATVEPLYPKGIRISVPHEDGITLVAYHVKFNEDFYSLEAGTIAVDIIKARNGRWVYEDRTTKLKRGDIVYYWVHVVYEGLGYNLLNQEYAVSDFYNYDGTPATSSGGTQACLTPSVTKIIGANGEQQNTCSGDLIFEDNFDQVNTSKWTVLEEFSKVPDYEFVVYMNSIENVDVTDGILHIKPVLVDEKFGAGFVRRGTIALKGCTDIADSPQCKRDAIGSYVLPPVISGRVQTKGKFTLLYGRIQVRAKLPCGDWLYPLITLESPDPTEDNAGMYYEIRVASASGNTGLKTSNGKDISGHSLWGGGLITTIQQNQIHSTNRMSLPTKPLNEFWSDDYHIYEVEWTPDRIVVKVDGAEYGRHGVAAGFNKPLYLNLGLAAGGHGEFPDMSTEGNQAKPWRNVESKALFKFYQARDNWMRTWTNKDTGLHVDYIKVLAL